MLSGCLLFPRYWRFEACSARWRDRAANSNDFCTR
jgi:hypothetical protein